MPSETLRKFIHNWERPLSALFFLLYGTAVLYYFHTSSPKLDFNPCPSPNMYLTIGQAMFDGFVPYRDLFDGKGMPIFLFNDLGGLLLTCKFTLAGFWLILVFGLLSHMWSLHGFKASCKCTSMTTLGAACITIPCIAYFAWHGAPDSYAKGYIVFPNAPRYLLVNFDPKGKELQRQYERERLCEFILGTASDMKEAELSETNFFLKENVYGSMFSGSPRAQPWLVCKGVQAPLEQTLESSSSCPTHI